jgi:hypothetical protein
MADETTQTTANSHKATARQRATADAAQHLAAFRAPAGAVKANGMPSGAPADLGQAAQTAADQNLVVATGWWTLAGAPESVRSWVSAHPPQGLTADGASSSITSGRTTAWTTDFAAPSVPGVLSERALRVTVAPLGTGRTVIRADAQDVWLPAKPASETIPSASVLTVQAVYGLHSVRGPIATPAIQAPGRNAPPGMAGGRESANPLVTTVTTPQTITRIAGMVDALQVTGPGARPCPMDTGSGIRLTFRSSVDGPVVAQVTANATGCGGVSVTVHGKPQPGLDGGPGLIQQIKSVLGLNWPGLG